MYPPLDVNESVVEIARAKAIDPAKAHFQIADAYDLPAFPRKLDGALVAFFWSHIPKARLGEFLRGLHRALAPGAAVLDNTYVKGNSSPITRRDPQGNTYQTRRLESGTEFEVLKNYPTEQELRGTLRFFTESVEVKWLKYYWWVSCHVTNHHRSEG